MTDTQHPIQAIMNGLMITLTRNPSLFRTLALTIKSVPENITREFPLWNTWMSLVDLASTGVRNPTIQTINDEVELRITHPILRKQIQSVIDSAMDEEVPELDERLVREYLNRLIDYGIGYAYQSYMASLREDLGKALEENPTMVRGLIARSQQVQEQLLKAGDPMFQDARSVFQTHSTGRLILPTGIKAMDAALHGGIRAGVSILMLLVSGHGKTTTAMHMILRGVEHGWKMESEFPGLPLFRQLAFQTEMPLSTHVRQLVAGHLGMKYDIVETYSAVQELLRPVNGIVNLDNAMILLKTKYPDFSEMDLDTLRQHVVESPLVDEFDSHQIEEGLDRIRRYTVFSDTINGRQDLMDQVRAGVRIEGAQNVILDHIPGINPTDIGRQAEHQFYSQTIFELIHLCNSLSTGLLMFSQLNGESSDALSGKKKKDTPIVAAISRGLINHSRVVMAGYRDPEVPMTTQMLVTKAPDLPRLPAFRMRYDPTYRRFRDVV